MNEIKGSLLRTISLQKLVIILVKSKHATINFCILILENLTFSVN